MSGIRLLVMDIDGVLTDGSITYDATGNELKTFHSHDGLGLRLWLRMGFQAAVITGRGGEAVRTRMRELGVAPVIEQAKDKGEAIDRLLADLGIPPSAAGYLGDDWPDLPAMRRVGYPMAVADAAEPVRRVARFVTTRPGGRGAAREAIEHLLGREGLMGRALALYDPPA